MSAEEAKSADRGTVEGPAAMRRAPVTARQKALAVGEVCGVFLLGVLVFRGLRQLGTLEALGGLSGLFTPRSFAPYGGLLVAVLALLILTGRSLTAYGLTLRPARYHLGIFLSGFIPVFLLAVCLTQIDWQSWGGAALVSVIALAMLALAAWLLRNKPTLPPLALLGLALAWQPAQASAGEKALLDVVYFYVFVGLAEEILFRGYLLSRLNEVFERRFSLLGIPFGPGLLISALLFGLWHAAQAPLNPLVWPQALWTTFAGLIFGLVREKSGSIAAPALLHGILNYGPQALLFDLFF